MRVLEKRETEEYGRARVRLDVPGQSNVLLTVALNEFNHSVQRFPSVAEYEAARANYLEDIVVREAHVEDAITGNNLRIKDQTLHISTATDAADNARAIPTEWKVNDVRDLVGLLLQPSPNRINGCALDAAGARARGAGHGQDVDGQAGGLHARRPAAARAGWQRRHPAGADRRLRAAHHLPAARDASNDDAEADAARRYIESVYSGKKYETWCDMLMQAYEMRALIVLLDGVDEAAGLREEIEGFVHKELVPSGNRVLVTSRPEGVSSRRTRRPSS